MLFFVRKAAAAGVVVLLIAAGCTPPASPPAPRTVAGTASHALANLASNAGNHEIAAAFAWYLHAAFAPAAHLAPAGPETLVNGAALDPMGAAALFGGMLAGQDIAFRTRVFYGVPEYGWYPIIEILDDDGDHAWDPFAGRFVPDYDRTPKSLFAAMQGGRAVSGGLGVAPPEVLTSFTPDAGDVGVPFAQLARYASFELDPRRAAVARHPVAGDWGVGAEDGSAADIEAAGVLNGDYLPALAYAGPTSGPVEAHNLAHQLVLKQLQPGAKYRVRIATVGDDAAKLITVPVGLKLVAQDRGPRYFTAEYAAQGTEATFGVAARLPARVAFDAWKWSRP